MSYWVNIRYKLINGTDVPNKQCRPWTDSSVCDKKFCNVCLYISVRILMIIGKADKVNSMHEVSRPLQT